MMCLVGDNWKLAKCLLDRADLFFAFLQMIVGDEALRLDAIGAIFAYV